VQGRVPDELRSRIMAVYATMFMGVQPLGALMAAVFGQANRRAVRAYGIRNGLPLASLFYVFRVPSGGASARIDGTSAGLGR